MFKLSNGKKARKMSFKKTNFTATTNQHFQQSINQLVPKVIKWTSLGVTLAQLSQPICCWYAGNGNVSSNRLEVLVSRFTQTTDWRCSRLSAVLRHAGWIFMQNHHWEKSNFELEACELWRTIVRWVIMPTRRRLCNRHNSHQTCQTVACNQRLEIKSQLSVVLKYVCERVEFTVQKLSNHWQLKEQFVQQLLFDRQIVMNSHKLYLVVTSAPLLTCCMWRVLKC